LKVNGNVDQVGFGYCILVRSKGGRGGRKKSINHVSNADDKIATAIPLNTRPKSRTFAFDQNENSDFSATYAASVPHSFQTTYISRRIHRLRHTRGTLVLIQSYIFNTGNLESNILMHDMQQMGRAVAIFKPVDGRTNNKAKKHHRHKADQIQEANFMDFNVVVLKQCVQVGALD
jgi:hypothetical protein